MSEFTFIGFHLLSTIKMVTPNSFLHCHPDIGAIPPSPQGKRRTPRFLIVLISEGATTTKMRLDLQFPPKATMDDLIVLAQECEDHVFGFSCKQRPQLFSDATDGNASSVCLETVRELAAGHDQYYQDEDTYHWPWIGWNRPFVTLPDSTRLDKHLY
jgi:hypothetical protein